MIRISTHERVWVGVASTEEIQDFSEELTCQRYLEDLFAAALERDAVAEPLPCSVRLLCDVVRVVVLLVPVLCLPENVGLHRLPLQATASQSA